MANLENCILGAPLGKTHLFSVGQAGYLIKSSSGQLLGIDLYLSECVERMEGHIGFKRLLPKLLQPFDLKLDVVIATHAHFDHFDIDSIPQILSSHNTKLLAAADCKELIEKLRLNSSQVTYVVPGLSVKVGDFNIHFIDCDHGDATPDAVGVIVEVDGKRILETGDTCLHLDWVDEYKKYGPIDVMIAPINGAYGNLNEQECAELSGQVKPEVTIPCHYGMFASHGGNPGRFMDFMRQQYPDNAFLLMAQGESLTV